METANQTNTQQPVNKSRTETKVLYLLVFVLVVAIAVLLVGNSLEESNRSKFYFLAIISVISFLIFLYFYRKKNKIDLKLIADDISKFHFDRTGLVTRTKEMEASQIDNITWIFTFPSEYKLITYFYDTEKRIITGYRYKKMDDVHTENNSRELTKELIKQNLIKEQKLKMNEEKLMDFLEDN